MLPLSRHPILLPLLITTTYRRLWNPMTQTRLCHLPRGAVKAKKDGMREVVEALIPYTERHLTRTERMVQHSYVLDFLIGGMDGGVVLRRRHGRGPLLARSTIMNWDLFTIPPEFEQNRWRLPFQTSACYAIDHHGDHRLPQVVSSSTRISLLCPQEPMSIPFPRETAYEA